MNSTWLMPHLLNDLLLGGGNRRRTFWNTSNDTVEQHENGIVCLTHTTAPPQKVYNWVNANWTGTWFQLDKCHIFWNSMEMECLPVVRDRALSVAVPTWEHRCEWRRACRSYPGIVMLPELQTDWGITDGKTVHTHSVAERDSLELFISNEVDCISCCSEVFVNFTSGMKNN